MRGDQLTGARDANGDKDIFHISFHISHLSLFRVICVFRGSLFRNIKVDPRITLNTRTHTKQMVDST